LIELEDKLKLRLKPDAKVMLVHPAFRYTGTDCFPLGLGYIAAYLKKFTKNIMIVDEHKFQIGRKQLEQIKPDIIGISSTTPAFYRVKKLLQSINRLPDSLSPLVLMGGTHATYCSEEVLQSGVDVAFIGEADTSIQAMFSNQFSDLSEVPGISYDLDGLRNITPRAPAIKDMDALPFPARELFDSKLYSVMSLTTSRGCPYACNYCAATDYWDYKVRYHSIDYVERELEQIVSLGYKQIIFEDATFSVNIKRAQNICERIIENKLLQEVTWSCETRPDRIKSEMIQTFEESRCILINLGVESASEIVLEKANRTVPLEKLYEGMKLIQETNIPLQVLMVFGLPGETRETVQETIKFLNDFKPDRIILSLATAYPGTELWNTTRRIDLPLSFVRKFTGHGEFSPLYLPEGFTEQTYVESAKEILEVVIKINKDNIKNYREKHKYIINKTASALCI